MKFAQVAFRNLSRQKRRSLLLAGAIAFGIFIVTLVNGFTAGTVRVIKENVAEMIGGHVFIAMQHREDDRTVEYIDDDSKIVARLKAMGIRDDQIARTSDVEQGSLVFNGKTTMQMVIGINWTEGAELKTQLQLDSDQWKHAISQPNGIILSKKTAERMKVELNDAVLIKCSTIHGQENVEEFIVTAITNDTSEFGGMASFANREMVNKLLDMPGDQSYIMMRIRLATLEEAPLFAAQLETELAKDYTIAPKDTNNFSFSSNVMKMPGKSSFTGERLAVTTVNDMLSELTTLSVGLSIFSLIVLVFLLLITMVGIANTFRMIMYERTKEIGTMRALGMHQNEVRRIMLYEAVFLSLMGVALGVVVAAFGMVVLAQFNFGTDSLWSMLLNNGHPTFRFDPLSMIVSTILVVVFTLLAALGPARKAARLEPAEALRSNF